MSVTQLSTYARRKARGLAAFTAFIPPGYIRKIKALAASRGMTLGQQVVAWADNDKSIDVAGDVPNDSLTKQG